jgi:hypothetical protein
MFRAANSWSNSFKRTSRFSTISMQSECLNECTPRAASSRSNIVATMLWMLTNPPADKHLRRQIRLNKELGFTQGKAAAWFQPHCGHPGQLQIAWYSNLAGVPTVEHPVPKMDSVQLPVAPCHFRANMARLAFQPPMLPAADPIAD